MKYQSEIVKQLIEEKGHYKSLPHYESECIEAWVEDNKNAYPKLIDYQAEWLNYANEHPIGMFPYETLSDVTNATVENVVPYAYKSAILKGNTKYRDIDTGDILDTFDETKNLELVSVKLPVLTTSNEDGTKTNILTVNEEVELRGIGDVKDTLDCLTGEVVERIGEIVLNGNSDETWVSKRNITINDITYLQYYLVSHPISSKNCSSAGSLPNIISDKGITDPFNGLWMGGSVKTISVREDNGSYYFCMNFPKNEDIEDWLSQNPITIFYHLETESIKTVDLTVSNQNGDTCQLKPIEGTMHLETSSDTIQPTFSGEIPVEATTQNLYSYIEE